MESTEKISIIMSTYTEPLSWIQAAIDSILQQTYRNIELIIVQDKPDRSELTQLLVDYKSRCECIQLIRNPENKGLIFSLNAGLKLCTGEYIARMDADDISHPNRLEMQLNYLKQHQLDLVGSGAVYFDESGDSELRLGLETYEDCIRMLRYRSCICHPTWLAKCSVFSKLNGYREIDSCEDYDFLVRAALMGIPMGCVREPLLHYRDNPDSISHTKLVKQRLTRRKIAGFYRKGTVMPIEDYQAYLRSDAFRRDCIDMERSLAIEAALKKTQNGNGRKLRKLLESLTCRSFWEEKLTNRIVRRIKKGHL